MPNSSTKIYSISLGPHDQNTYDGVLHRQIERYNRLKHNIPWHMDVYPHHSELERMNRDDNTEMVKFYNEYWNLMITKYLPLPLQLVV